MALEQVLVLALGLEPVLALVMELEQEPELGQVLAPEPLHILAKSGHRGQKSYYRGAGLSQMPS